MKRKTVALTLIPTLLTLALVETLLVDSAYANFMPLNTPPHSIEITADGNVTGTDNIKHIGTTYEFTANISGSIVVLCDNITINGNGYSLTGNGDSTGFFLEGRQNVTIKNLTISNFEDGIVYSYYRNMYSDCKNNALIANNITNNKWGVYCYHAQNITISGNVISNNSKTGIITFNSGQIQIYENTLSENNVAVRFTNCQNSNVYGNNFINNTNQTSVDPESNSGLNYGWSTINWNNRRLGNFWSDYNGTDANGDGIGDTPYVIDENNQDNYPLVYPWGATEVSVLSFENVLYSDNVSLNFTVSKPVRWMSYSLDGQDNVTVTGNFTLSGLATGLHNLTVYVTDVYGITGASETVTFTIEPEPFPTALVIAASGASIAIIGVGLLVYFKKRKR